MGIEGKPKELVEKIIAARDGDSEAKKYLSAAGKKGAKVRAENKDKRETILDYNEQAKFDSFYSTELSRLESTYPEVDDEGVPVDDAWRMDLAKKYADSMMKLTKILKG